MTIQPKREQDVLRLTELAKKAAEPLGLSVLSVRLSQQGNKRSLEVCIARRKGAVGLSDCEQISRALDQELEADAQSKDPIVRGAYLLEVVSPGIDRQLSGAYEFDIFAGEQIRVKAKESIANLGDDFSCILLMGDDQFLTVMAAEPIRAAGAKDAKSKEAKKVKQNGEAQAHSAKGVEEEQLKIDLSKVFRVNLYCDDLKRK
jgi:ribosome maturation factor RimP